MHGLRFASAQIIRFSSGSLFAILKNTVRLRFDKTSVKPVYKTPVQVRFDSLSGTHEKIDVKNFMRASSKNKRSVRGVI